MSNVVRYMENPKHYITFNGKDFRDFKVYCNGTDTYTVPQHEYETVQIPGRNGDFKRDLGRFQQVTIPYDCWIGTNFDTNIKALREYLMSVTGYATLADTYHPNTYRKAIFEGPIEVKPAIGLSFGSFVLNFNCKPERWLTSGDTSTTITTGDTMANPTNFESRPTLKLVGNGTITVTNGAWSCSLTVEDYGYTLTQDTTMQSGKTYYEYTNGSYVVTSDTAFIVGKKYYEQSTNPYTSTEYTIDNERLYAISSGGDNMNLYITPSDRDNWITLKPGTNTITFTGFSSVKIIPRWWTI